MAGKDKAKEGVSALEDEIKNAPAPEVIEAASPVKASESTKKDAETKVEAVASEAAPLVDKAASDKIAAEKAAAEKATKKAQKEEAKKKAKIEKKAKKAAEYQTKVEQCPKDYRPVSTGVFFWTGILCMLPVIGLVFTLLFSLIPRNKNFKNFARAILAGYVILIIVFLIFAIIATFVMGQSISDFIWPFEKFFSDMATALGF
ncbi:MAG: hypothetical protein IJ757_04675 [Clostridiales bacterium]|nr:hypothetical protein [Clostridiales bacterium]